MKKKIKGLTGLSNAQKIQLKIKLGESGNGFASIKRIEQLGHNALAAHLKNGESLYTPPF